MRSKVNPRQYLFAVAEPVTGVAQAGGGNSQIILALGAVTANDQFNRMVVCIASGTGSGQAREVVDSVAASDTLTVDRAWDVNPDATSNYSIYEWLRPDFFYGIAQAGAARSITLGTGERSLDDYYNDLIIEPLQGTGAPLGIGPSQQRMIVDYDQATRVATVNAPWAVNPAANTRYRIQGHLYHPCRDVELYESAGKALRIGYHADDIGMGRYNLAVKYGDASAGILPGAGLYVATNVGAGAGTLHVNRWE